MGWRSGPIIIGLNDAKKSFNVIATICVGLEAEDPKTIAKMKKKNNVENLFYVRGAVNRSKLTKMQKLLFAFINLKMLLFNHTDEDKLVRNMMKNGGDLSSEDQLSDAITWISNNVKK